MQHIFDGTTGKKCKTCFRGVTCPTSMRKFCTICWHTKLICSTCLRFRFICCCERDDINLCRGCAYQKPQLPELNPSLCLSCFRDRTCSYIRCSQCFQVTFEKYVSMRCQDGSSLFSCLPCTKTVTAENVAQTNLIQPLIRIITDYLFEPLSIGTWLELNKDGCFVCTYLPMSNFFQIVQVNIDSSSYICANIRTGEKVEIDCMLIQDPCYLR